jgi:N-methylhydantoinase A/oxoprolinase/acetone carboxylase beta subunit
VDTPIHPRDELTPGMTFDGPAIIEQSDSTPLVAPGFRARVDEAHNLLLERV